ncbi:UDP-glucose dehydrogenase family protein [Deinococcus cellulosilyticus]|uniref:UDP-glucose 6-dehydrogenase n=1 Tax=Deinococcus cellulosilyticus (strain DSM 18568 / NBRC 106333 / KACC 11606 / 5516J-15) TaxID=1223518 RepID=A0A511N531_DEIC1|nr:UDP-glucose/GDP-mannose dehydrogenase family protein [Deinococcus cellulosilyticus]GEM47588.1 UDP-glucose 6-dehydrogenase [Deinococcus cellulosilyticus NBRC 106333 = KACC 11606]
MSASQMTVAVVGTGYVGLTTGVALAYLGHHIIAIDKDPRKIELLSKYQSPIHEKGLQELLTTARSKITVTPDYEPAAEADVIIIAVGTPPKQNGEADTRFVEAAARDIASVLKADRDYVVVVKSTVPIGSNRRVASVIEKVLAERGVVTRVTFASNPEFLREGMALHDTLYPDRIVIGSEKDQAISTLRKMYQPLLEQTFDAPSFLPRPASFPLPPLITTDPTSAEMIKYAANAFLAVKISFINEVAGLCEKVGADVLEVARGMGLDSRIGPKFLQAGLGWGGSCFPKDTQALQAIAGEYGYTLPIIHASREVNARQRVLVLEKLQSALKVLRGRTITVLGMAFKPGTDDVRDSPGMELMQVLLERGVHVRGHDPIAIENARNMLADMDIKWCEDVEESMKEADAILIATDWPEYKHLPWNDLVKHMKTPVIVDARNILSHYDFDGNVNYIGVGR